MSNELKHCPQCKKAARAIVCRPTATHEMHEYCFDCNYKFKDRKTREKQSNS